MGPDGKTPYVVIRSPAPIFIVDEMIAHSTFPAELSKRSEAYLGKYILDKDEQEITKGNTVTLQSPYITEQDIVSYLNQRK